MADDESKRTITVAEERVERMLGVVALASAEAFDEAMALLVDGEQDTFAMIEETLRMFLMELKEAKEQGRRAMSELSAAKSDLERKLETIEHQQLAIQRLSTPILDVWDDILTVPLIGAMDRQRAEDAADKLLRRVVAARAQWVILDVTGVEALDAETADHLVRLAKAARLIGSRCIVTGIGADIASALVSLGVDLTDLRPMRSLKDGLRYCFAQRALRRAAG